jgi:hypothetical protein
LGETYDPIRAVGYIKKERDDRAVNNNKNQPFGE